MSVTAAVLRELMAAGLAGAELAAAVERIEQAEAPPASPGALRTRRWRANKASRVTSQASHVTVDSVTVTSRDVTCDAAVPSPSSPSSSPLTLPLITTPTPTPSKKADARATRLPAEWQPSADDLSAAAARNLVGIDLRSEIEKFRNYWHAKGGKDAAKRDWPATWRNWVINWSERRGQRSGNPRRTDESSVLAGLARGLGLGDGELAGAADQDVPRGRFEFDAEPTRRS